jgi:hypothetical protein
MPIEPANAHRAMFCSRRFGSTSMRLTWEMLTKAPDDGLKSMKERRRGMKPPETADATSEKPKRIPPATISVRLRHASARMPSTGSMTLPKMPGMPRIRPTWT